MNMNKKYIIAIFVISILFVACKKKDCSQLEKAVGINDINEIKKCIKSGIDLNKDLGCGWRYLHNAVVANSVEAGQILIENGANLEAKTDEGWTPLHLAAQKGALSFVTMLINMGADIHSKNDTNDTPLHYAAHFGHNDICKLLIEHGADVNMQNKSGWSPLHIPHSSSKQDGYVPTAKILLENGAKINLRDDDGWTPLMFAGVYGNYDLFIYLINNGADKNIKSKSGVPIICAITAGCAVKDVIRCRQDEILKYLINHGVDVNEKCGKQDSCNTALHIAAIHGLEKIAKLLIDKGANIQLKNGNDMTPLDCAIKYRNMKLVRLIRCAIRAHKNSV